MAESEASRPAAQQARLVEPGDLSLRLVEPARRDDLAAALALYLRTWTREEWPHRGFTGTHERYLEWLIEPHTSVHGHVVLAHYGDELVSVRSWITRRVIVRGRAKVAGIGGAGIAVPAEWRGRHVNNAVSLGLRRDRARDLGIKFSNRFTPMDARFAVPVGPSLGVYLRVLAPYEAARGERLRLLRAAGYAALGLIGRLRRTASLASLPRGVRIREADQIDPMAFGLFWTEAHQAWDFIPERTAEFLNWRYRDPRAGSYTILVAEEEHRTLAYVVLKAAEGRGHIVDILGVPGRPDVLEALLARALEWFRAANVGAVECWLMGRAHPYRSALRRAGFVRLPWRSRAVTRMLKIGNEQLPSEEIEFLAAPDARVHLVLGDYDAI